MTEWEIWACAHKLRQRYGEDAQVHAALRMDAMFKADDREGYWVWSQILAAISKLGPPDPDATMH